MPYERRDLPEAIHSLTILQLELDGEMSATL
jgi:hypothetical protein